MKGHLSSKLEKLKEGLKRLEGVLVAYSGGVDSTLLLRVARDVLNERVLAVTARSPIHPEREYREAKEMAEALGVRLLSIWTDELSQVEFSRNDRDRCYWCKRWLLTELKDLARREGLEWVVEGSNLDDLKGYRPGMRARDELGVRSPLCEAGLNKEEVRLLSKELGLPTWDKPSLACLASRIPYGTPITRELLRKVERAEEVLLSMGLRQVRVRHHGRIARIEVEPAEMERLLRRRTELVSALRGLGYGYVTLDLEGYRSGSLNEIGDDGDGHCSLHEQA